MDERFTFCAVKIGSIVIVPVGHIDRLSRRANVEGINLHAPAYYVIWRVISHSEKPPKNSRFDEADEVSGFYFLRKRSIFFLSTWSIWDYMQIKWQGVTAEMDRVKCRNTYTGGFVEINSGGSSNELEKFVYPPTVTKSLTWDKYLS